MDAKRRVVIGLTGVIATGKSHILQLFAEAGAATASSDAFAHEVLQGEAFAEVARIFPEAVENGQINRQRLSKIVFADASRKAQLEAIMHPLVRKRNLEFIKNAKKDVVVLEIPLLFEAKAEEICDFVVVANVSRETIFKRALARPNMTHEKLQQILISQMPQHEKIERADFVIDNEDEHDTVAQVDEILRKIDA